MNKWAVRLFAMAIMLAGALLFRPAATLAQCASGSPVDYSDIDGILYTYGYRTVDNTWQGLDGYQPQRSANYQPAELESSNFWALWSETPPNKYEQFSLKDHVGDFQLFSSLSDVIDVLRRDRFYQLSSPFVSVTDVTYSVLTVRRCSVVTRIMVPNADSSSGVDAPTQKLFADMLSLVNASKKVLSSATPMAFNAQMLFDQ